MAIYLNLMFSVVVLDYISGISRCVLETQSKCVILNYILYGIDRNGHNDEEKYSKCMVSLLLYIVKRKMG